MTPADANASIAAMPDGFDPKATHVVHEWKYTSPLIACRFDPRGRFVLSTAEDNAVQRWEFPSGKLTTLKGHDSWPRAIAFSPDGAIAITVGSDETMIQWELAAEAPQPLRSVRAHTGWIRTVATSRDGRWIATGGNDGLVKLWNANDATLVQEFAGHESHVYSVIFDASDQFLVSGDLSGQVRQWELSTGRQTALYDAKDLHSFNAGQKVNYGGVRALSISPSGERLCCGGLHKATNPLGAINEPLLLVFQRDTKKLVRSHIADGVRGVIWDATHLRDGTMLAASGGSGGGYLLFWNDQNDKTFHQFKLKDTVRGMDLHQDQLHVATTHWDRHLRISRLAK